MKKYYFSLLSVFFVTALCVGFTSCGSDDDGDSNDGTAASYTEQEIMDILKGEWEVSGNLSITFNKEENQKYNFSGEYTAQLTFDPKDKNTKTYKFEILEGDKMSVSDYDSDFYPEEAFISIYTGSYNYKPYKLVKKNGNYYVVFRDDYYFEIQSITKTSFRMVLDQDIENTLSGNKEVIGHAHMTLYSK